jgi:hypothetical protein
VDEEGEREGIGCDKGGQPQRQLGRPHCRERRCCVQMTHCLSTNPVSGPVSGAVGEAHHALRGVVGRSETRHCELRFVIVTAKAET